VGREGAHADRASAILPTQGDAEARAKEIVAQPRRRRSPHPGRSTVADSATRTPSKPGTDPHPPRDRKALITRSPIFRAGRVSSARYTRATPGGHGPGSALAAEARPSQGLPRAAPAPLLRYKMRNTGCPVSRKTRSRLNSGRGAGRVGNRQKSNLPLTRVIALSRLAAWRRPGCKRAGRDFALV